MGLYLYSTYAFGAAGSSYQLQTSEQKARAEERFMVTSHYCENCTRTLNASIPVDVKRGETSSTASDLWSVDEEDFWVISQPIETIEPEIMDPDGEVTGYSLWKKDSEGTDKTVAVTDNKNSTYIWNDVDDYFGGLQLFSLENSAATWNISNVKVVVWAKANTSPAIGEEMSIVMRTEPDKTKIWTSSETFDLSVDYSAYEFDWSFNPITGEPWTWAEIFGLEAGVLTVETQTCQNVSEIYVNITGAVENSVEYQIDFDVGGLNETWIKKLTVVENGLIVGGVEWANVSIYNVKNGEWETIVDISDSTLTLKPWTISRPQYNITHYINSDYGNMSLTVNATGFGEFDTVHDWLAIILGVENPSGEALDLYVFNYGNKEIVVSAVYIDKQLMNFTAPDVPIKVYGDPMRIPVEGAPYSGRVKIVSSRGNAYEYDYEG